MNTCDTCKWWTDTSRLAEHHGYRQYFGICENPKVNLEGFESYVKEEEANKVQQDGAGASCSDEMGLVFKTGPKFGCIHHEAK